MRQKLAKLVIASVYLFSFFANAQEINQEIKKPKEGKALVYFVRSNSVGFALNFRVYDKDKFLGQLVFNEYIVYECEPGQHVFWAASENRDFVEADLEENKTYVIDVRGQMGAFIVGVNVVPLKPNDKRAQKDLYKIVKNENMVLYNPSIANSVDKQENIKNGMEKYNELKERKSNKIKVLTRNMNFDNANKYNSSK